MVERGGTATTTTTSMGTEEEEEEEGSRNTKTPWGVAGAMDTTARPLPAAKTGRTTTKGSAILRRATREGTRETSTRSSSSTAATFMGAAGALRPTQSTRRARTLAAVEGRGLRRTLILFL